MPDSSAQNPAPSSGSASDKIYQELLALSETVSRQAGQIARIEATIRDLCELVTLPAAERQERRVVQQHQSYERLKIQIRQIVARRRFDSLEPLLAELDRLFGDEPDAEEVKLAAWAARDAALSDTLSGLQEAVRRHVATADWPGAQAAVEAALQWFPDQPEILAIRVEIERTQAVWLEQATGLLQAKIKAAADQRQWRAALSAAEELLQRFPGHTRATKLAGEIATLRQNADIEVRQQLEQQLQSLVRSRRFGEAVVLAEQIINDYPTSPQAAECKALLPRLEAMTLDDESEGSAHQS
jgi:hypothetical protein